MHYGYIPIKSCISKMPLCSHSYDTIARGQHIWTLLSLLQIFLDQLNQKSVKIYELAGGVGTFWRFTAHLSCRQWRGSAPPTWPPLWPWTCHQFVQSRRLKRLQLELNTLAQALNMAILLNLTRFLTDDRVIPKPLPTGQTLSEWRVGKVNWFVKSPRELV